MEAILVAVLLLLDSNGVAQVVTVGHPQDTLRECKARARMLEFNPPPPPEGSLAILGWYCISLNPGMAELVDAGDLKSPDQHRGGSSPSTRTI